MSGKSASRKPARPAKAIDYERESQRVRDAWYALGQPTPASPAVDADEWYVCAVMDDAVVISGAGAMWNVPYTTAEDGTIQFAARDQWQQVEEVYAPVAAEALPADALVMNGGEIKSLGNGRYGGFLARYSTDKDPDLTRDFFDAKTNYGTHTKTPIYYNHGLDDTLGKRVIGEGEIIDKEAGKWLEFQLYQRDDYEKAVARMCDASKCGLSSGTATHLVEREPVGKAMHITSWPLGLDASVTPTPAEPRNAVLPLKSLPTAPTLKALLQAAGDAANAGTATANSSSQGATQMDPETKSAIDGLLSIVKENTEAVKALISKPGGTSVQIESKGGFATVQASDTLKTPYKSFKSGGFGDFLGDVAKASRPGATPNARLVAVRTERENAFKAIQGANETVPSEGGWLTQTDHETELLKLTYDSGVLTSRCNRRSLGGPFNSTVVFGRDESSRANGSRWGGVVGYRLDEGATIPTSKPAFRKIELKLKKYAAAVYATDEELQDTNLLEQEVMESAPKELAFMADDDVMNGLGVGGPLGFMRSPALITVSKEAGQVANAIVFQNIVHMWARRWAAITTDYVWLINQDVEPELFSMALPVGVGGVPVFLPPTGLSGSPYSSLFNRPVIPTEFNATLGTTGDVALVALSQYKLIDKGVVQQASSIHVEFLTDQTVFRFIYRIDGQPIWSKPLTPFKGTNTLSPFIVLETRN